MAWVDAKLSWADAVFDGDRLAALRAYRDALAAEMVRLQRNQSANEAAGRDFSMMGRELRLTLQEIAELDDVAVGDVVDELSRQRKQRRSGA